MHTHISRYVYTTVKLLLIMIPMLIFIITLIIIIISILVGPVRVAIEGYMPKGHPGAQVGPAGGPPAGTAWYSIVQYSTVLYSNSYSNSTVYYSMI